MKAIFQLLRLNQWIKNLFVFLPVFFSGNLLNRELLVDSCFAFLTFCFTTSMIYILNDYKDVEKDRMHPVKKHRPLASGKLSKRTALLLFVPLIIGLGLVVFYRFDLNDTWPLIVYFVLNLLYTFGLKSIPILDVGIIAVGFVLRVVLGGLVTGIIVSKWAFLLTFALALVLALGKRRGELLSTDGSSRRSLKGYNLSFLDAALTSTVTITIVCYIMYSVSPAVENSLGFKHVYITSVFVILGVLRYLQQTFVYSSTESPTRLLYKDLFIQVTILLWISTFALIIYFK
ncbi:MAG: UbiA prenyltransferase family protein [Bacteroidia bacterium]|nr:UbiA prenyltransferase family protein [Bacteroidia bacterium]NNF31724.1 UbiA prenyltransferase family protein [Flavobacteriaceae bacterium]NNJ81115.1 UbiA prenyltransferase family protein [Flavobacteriaceae bacterium]NNK55238.1 UbiA prenyltransferase family protein [Flavobacteriaceae bacterium]NNM10233.1 UbiA prenyltransferase family protein [Flavobacteriaceae bacterium]